MAHTTKSSRRKFLGNTAAIGAIGAIGASQLIKACSSDQKLAEAEMPVIPDTAPDGPLLKAGVIGCGGRGTGAAFNYLNAGPNVSIYAVADVFQDKVDGIRKKLKENKDIELDDANCFVGFDAYKRLLETDVDVVILATPPYFRPEQFQASVEARKHIFMEKPVAVDPVGTRAVMAASKQAEAAGLCVVTGTQRRHQRNYIDIYSRIEAGHIGTPVASNVYWNQSKLWHREKQPGWTEMEGMLRDWVNWTWLSGDHIVEQHVHNIDVNNWFLGKPPILAVGMGSRQRRMTGDCYDNFSIDFVYEDNIHMHSMCRQINDCANNVGEYMRGTDGFTNCRTKIWGADNSLIYEYVDPVDENGEKIESNPYDQEHVDLVTAIRTGIQIVEAEETAKSNLTAIMGRESAYTGKQVTWDEIMGSDLKLGPEGDLNMGSINLKAVIPIPGSVSV